MQRLPAAKTKAPGPRRSFARDGRGFTLAEVLVATVLLSMVILGVLAVLIGSYRVAAKARYNDQARYVIKSFADQFLTQQSTDGSGNILPMFAITYAASGYGLTWTNADGTTSTGASSDTYIPVLLGQNTGGTIKADVSRSVNYLYTSGGNMGYGTISSS
jgi:type II secretory pathway pseudopilin PulG